MANPAKFKYVTILIIIDIQCIRKSSKLRNTNDITSSWGLINFLNTIQLIYLIYIVNIIRVN